MYPRILLVPQRAAQRSRATPRGPSPSGAVRLAARVAQLGVQVRAPSHVGPRIPPGAGAAGTTGLARRRRLRQQLGPAREAHPHQEGCGPLAPEAGGRAANEAAAGGRSTLSTSGPCCGPAVLQAPHRGSSRRTRAYTSACARSAALEAEKTAIAVSWSGYVGSRQACEPREQARSASTLDCEAGGGAQVR